MTDHLTVQSDNLLERASLVLSAQKQLTKARKRYRHAAFWAREGDLDMCDAQVQAAVRALDECVHQIATLLPPKTPPHQRQGCEGGE